MLTEQEQYIAKTYQCENNYALIKLHNVSDKRSLFYLPDVSKDDPEIGTVIAIGPGFHNLRGTWLGTTLKPGDVILFNKYAGFKTETDGLRVAGIDVSDAHEYRMIQESPTSNTDIWAKIVDGRMYALADRVILKELPGHDRTAGGLYLPDSAINSNKGTVLSIGPGAIDEDGKHTPIEVSLNDTVVFNTRGRAHKAKFEEVEYWIVPEIQIAGVWVDAPVAEPAIVETVAA